MGKIEVIAWTLKDIIDIQEGGADRIELVVDLDKGGLSPNLLLVKQVAEIATIPVRVMVREHDESFVYDEQTMNKHIKYVKELSKLDNIDGIVFGSLTSDNKINFDQLKSIIKVKGNMKLTFHRAFDEIDEEDFLEQFDELSKYDVDTLLTSGLKSSALLGKENIKKLVDKKTINILPGKSISIDNSSEIVKYTGADYIHVGYSVRNSSQEHSIILPNEIRKIKESIK